MTDWITCDVCEAEYKIVTSLMSAPQYCPFCGTETETDTTDEDYDWGNLDDSTDFDNDNLDEEG